MRSIKTSEKFKQKWKERTGKELVDKGKVSLPAHCQYMKKTGNLIKQLKPCMGQWIICANRKCPIFETEMPSRNCRPERCKFFKNGGSRLP